MTAPTAATTAVDACPRCARPRLGFLRYCVDCGFDFDAPDAAPPTPAEATGASAEAGSALPRSAALLGAPLPPAPPRSPLLAPLPAPPAPEGATPKPTTFVDLPRPAVFPRARPTPTESPAPATPEPVEAAPVAPVAPALIAAEPMATQPGPSASSRAVGVVGLVGRRLVMRLWLIAQALVLAVVIVAVLGLVSTALSQQGRGLGPLGQPGGIGEPETSVGVGGQGGSTEGPPFGPTGRTEIAEVVSITDGDTIRVRIGSEERPVRYIGIDTPEPDAADAGIRAMAAEAAAANATLVEGRTVILERDVSDTDPFDRLLRHVWIETTEGYVLVNLELVRQGMAEVTTYPPDIAYVDELVAAQALARRAQVGLWRPSDQPTAPVTIDDRLRAIEPGATQTFTGGSGAYRWTTLALSVEQVTVGWDATAPAAAGCTIFWTIEPVTGALVEGEVEVEAGTRVAGERFDGTPFTDAALAVESTCGGWTLTIEG